MRVRTSSGEEVQWREPVMVAGRERGEFGSWRTAPVGQADRWKSRREIVGKRRNWGRISRSFIPALVIALFVLGISAAAASNSAAQGSAATVNIAIGDNTFTPAQITVNVGNTVVWTNTGRNPHDVTADSGAFFSPRNM